MQQKTIWLFCFLLLPLTVALGSCSANPTDPPTNPPGKSYHGITLRVACPDEETARTVEQASRGWAARAAPRILTSRYDPEKSQIPDESADAWVLEASQLPRQVSAGRLRPLPDAFTAAKGEFHWPGLLDWYGNREGLLVWDRVAHAVPLLGEAPLCFYRKDLFAEPHHVEAFGRRFGRKPGPPATWDEFAALAEYFAQERMPGTTTRSLPPLPQSDRELDRLFHTVAASHVRRALGTERDPAREVSREERFSYHFDATTGRPRIAEAGFVQALRTLQRLQAFRAPGGESEPGRAFLEDKAVLCLADARLLGKLLEKGAPNRDQVGVCPVPGHRGWYDFQTGQLRGAEGTRENRVPYLGAGAFVLAVPRSAAQSEAAFALLEELGGKAVSQQIVLEPERGGGATRLAHLDEDWAGFRLDLAQTLELRRALRWTLQPLVSNPVLCLRVPREHEFRTKLVDKIRPALEATRAATDEAASALLQEVSREWTTLIGTQTVDHLRAYRLSLGLDER